MPVIFINIFQYVVRYLGRILGGNVGPDGIPCLAGIAGMPLNRNRRVLLLRTASIWYSGSESDRGFRFPVSVKRAGYFTDGRPRQ